MFATFSASSINKLFYAILDASFDWTKGVVRREERPTIDSPGPVCCHLSNPRNRVLTIPGRGSSFMATCAETLWVLAGRYDMRFLTQYLPRAADFSDDGEKWRAGYGPRIRGLYGDRFPDQLLCVIDELERDNKSRRAVMTLLEPVSDYNALLFTEEGTKDFPCTQSLSFMVRKGKLDLTVFIRSNDFIWGWSHINVYEFCTLQELVSSVTGIPLGEFYIISNSLHIYEDNSAKRVSKINSQKRFDIYDYCTATPFELTSLSNFDTNLDDCMQFLESPGKEEWTSQCWLESNLVGDLGLVAWFTQANPDKVLEAVDSIVDWPTKFAALEWLVRNRSREPYMEYINKLPEPIKRYILGETKQEG